MSGKVKERSTFSPENVGLLGSDQVARIARQASPDPLRSVELLRLELCFNLLLSELQAPAANPEDVSKLRRGLTTLRRAVTPRRALVLEKVRSAHRRRHHPQGHAANDAVSTGDL